MKIEGLKIKDFKGLKVVDIKPIGNSIVVAGKNGAGKSSVLDGIQIALCGKDRKNPLDKPIRGKEKRAEIIIKTTEDYVVKRIFTDKGDQLKVESQKGVPFKKPQELLSRLFSDVGLEPAEFANAEPGAQTELLLQAVELPFDEKKFNELTKVGVYVPETGSPLDAINSAVLQAAELRTIAARDAKKLRSAFDAVDLPEGAEDAEPVSASELLSERQALVEIQMSNKKYHDEMKSIDDDIMLASTLVRDLKKEFIALQTRLESEKQMVINGKLKKEEQQKLISTLTEPDFTEIDEKIANADKQNELAQAVKYKKEKGGEADAAEGEHKALDKTVEKLREFKADMLAKAKFPVKGMSIDDEGILTVDGVPLRQRSTAENIVTGMEIQRALNPDLRVMLFRDGNQLDAETFTAVKLWAEENDYQVWVERVSDGPAEGVIYLEEGEIAG